MGEKYRDPLIFNYFNTILNHDLRYYKDGPVIQKSITSVIPIVTLQQCVGYTNKIWVDRPGWVKVPGPFDFYIIMVFVIQKRTCYANGYNFRYIYCDIL